MKDQSDRSTRPWPGRLLAILLTTTLALSGCKQASEESGGNTDEAAVADRSVVVVGAGLAGLNAALLLEEQGYQVEVLEARERVGGRLYTLDQVPGNPEAGGNIIGPNYARVLDRARQLGLELVPATSVVGGMRTMSLYIDDTVIAPKDWAGATQNPFPQPLKRVPPPAVLSVLASRTPLATPGDWLDPKFAEFDTPVRKILLEKGFNERSLELVQKSNTQGRSLAGTSLLKLYHGAANQQAARQMGGGLKSIAGGNQRLPEAMMEAVQGPVRLGEVVTRVRQDEDVVEVVTASGKRYRAAHAVLTVPLSVMDAIAFEPSLPATKQEAIAALEYTAAMLVQLTVNQPYWQDAPPSLWTDTPIGRIFATSLDGSGEVTNITLWIAGDDARHFSAMPAAQRDREILAAFYRIYPEAEGAVQLQTVVDWTADPFSGGAWLHWQPGQIQRYHAELLQPAGRIYFAGEHSAEAHTGMERAMESAESAVRQLLQDNAAADEPDVAAQRSARPDTLFACVACHSFKPGEPHKLGPNLAGIIGHKAGTREGYGYSEALQNSDIEWNKQNLRAWLEAPEQLVPGTKMFYRNSMSEQELDELVHYLSKTLAPGG